MTNESIKTRLDAIATERYPMITDLDVEALRMAIKAIEQVPKLQNRCYALTQGQMCLFCPYECERRTANKRESESERDNA